MTTACLWDPLISKLAPCLWERHQRAARGDLPQLQLFTPEIGLAVACESQIAPQRTVWDPKGPTCTKMRIRNIMHNSDA